MSSNLVRIQLLKFPANFSGNFGGWSFDRCVSEPMSRREAERLSAVTSVKFLDGAESMRERRLRERGEVIEQLAAGKKPKPKSQPAPAPAPAPAPEPAKSKAQPQYSRAELEAIADKEGTPGLRKVADQYGVKARSIRDLIEAILKAQEHG